MTHDLKIRPEWFIAVISGVKTFEIRKDDRNSQPRDELLLREWDGMAYTGRTCKVDVTMVLRGEYCREGYCTMAIRMQDGNDPVQEFEQDECRKMTNGDRIRRMTDEELQQFLCQISTCETCPFAGFGCKVDEWLKQEAKGDAES